MSQRVGVIGAGSWGTTLAAVLGWKGIDTTLWVYEQSSLEAIRKSGENVTYLPGIKLPSSLKFTGDLPTAVNHSDFLILAVPTHAMGEVCRRIAPLANRRQIAVNVSKGIENDSLLRMSEVITAALPIPAKKIVTLYGPSHAEEVSRQIATAVVSASTNLESARLVRDLFMTSYFRVYSSSDIIGVEVGGSLKNVIAIAAGIADGAGFGDNTKAALLTRGLFEISRLGEEMGAKADTFAGLSGMGDLIVTCMSKHSRNRHVGEQIGRGRSLQDILNEMIMVAEGVKTTRSAYQLASKYDVDMPICEQVYLVLFEGKNPHQAVEDLMQREAREER